MKKICHMISAHGSEDERIFHKECFSLINNGYDVYEVFPGKSYKKNGVTIIGLNIEVSSRIQRMTTVCKAVYQKALKLDADLYHFHDPELLPYGLKLAKKGKKVIFDSHENTVDQIYEKEWIPRLIRVPLYHTFNWYQKYVCSKLTAVISVSPHICEYFEKIQKHTVKITNYPKWETIGSGTTLTEGRALCFAGGISELWNHDKVIKAIEEIDDIKYVLCGLGDENYIQELENLAGWEKVDFRGKIPHETVQGILSKCSIGVSILSYNRNAGGKRGTQGNTKIYEQMMAGLPVVCTDFELWKEFVNRYHCGICVNPDSVEEIRDAIQYLLDNPEEARRMGQNGRRAIKEEFNWSVEEKKLLALYKEILEE